MTLACVRAFVGLGSNLNDPVRQLQLALAALAALPHTRLDAVSGFYANPAMGPPQPDYVNAVARLDTALAPLSMLTELQTIEYRRGRRRDGRRWGPRTLDLDLLLFGSLELANDRLTLPHPGVAERAFVLVPLVELAPDLLLPDGRALASLKDRTVVDGLTRLSLELPDCLLSA